jgi:hypothetical protein
MNISNLVNNGDLTNKLPYSANTTQVDDFSPL